MAVTFNLPIKEWYFDSTHEGTLDYPPLFASFEFLLALIAHLLNLNADGKFLALSKTAYRTDLAIVYQKLTVVASDCVLYYGVYKLCKSIEPLAIGKIEPVERHDKKSQDAKNGKNDEENKNNRNKIDESKEQIVSNKKQDKSSSQDLLDATWRPDTCTCIALLLIFQPGLLMIDHIHFQYNGFLSGILLLSLSDIVNGQYIRGGFWFSILLNLKHIYLYCAPALGMYLLSSYCLTKEKDSLRIVSLMKKAGGLGSVVLLVFFITYLPFAELNTLMQIVSRLFPFKRGLTHAYWAPNAWSLYNLADKILATIYKDSLEVKFDLDSISKTRRVSSTSGLVEEYEHQYLPSVKPLATFVLVGVATVPVAIKYLLGVGTIKPKLFLKGVALTAFTSFMFGWHVHEKAIITVLLPLIPISCLEPNLWPTFLRLTLAGTYSLFPLLFKPAEYITKTSLTVAYYCYASSLSNPRATKRGPRFQGLLDKAYLLLLILNELYMTLLFGRLNYDWNPAAKLNRFEFLPLMLTSTFSAIGITLSYIELYLNFLLDR